METLSEEIADCGNISSWADGIGSRTMTHHTWLPQIGCHRCSWRIGALPAAMLTNRSLINMLLAKKKPGSQRPARPWFFILFLWRSKARSASKPWEIESNDQHDPSATPCALTPPQFTLPMQLRQLRMQFRNATVPWHLPAWFPHSSQHCVSYQNLPFLQSVTRRTRPQKLLPNRHVTWQDASPDV